MPLQLTTAAVAVTMTRMIDPDLRLTIWRGGAYSLVLCFIAGAAWVLALGAPEPLDIIFTPIAWIATVPAGAMLLVTLALLAFAYATRDRGYRY